MLPPFSACRPCQIPPPLPCRPHPCSKEGKWEETYLGLLGEQAGVEARQCSAYATCRGCHSGGALEPVLCDNGECPVTYSRLACSSRLQQLDAQLRRLDIF